MCQCELLHYTRFLNRTRIPAACLRKGERNSFSPLNMTQRDSRVREPRVGVSLQAGVLVSRACGAAVPVCLSELLSSPAASRALRVPRGSPEFPRCV